MSIEFDFLNIVFLVLIVLFPIVTMLIWKKKIPYFIFLDYVFVFGISFFLSIWEANNVDRELRNHLLLQAKSLASNINIDLVNALTFTEQDKQNPSFKRLQKYLRKYSKTINVRGIYTLAKKGDELVFGPESYSEYDPDASPPGTIYQEPSEGLLSAFQTGEAFTEGPIKDEYGIYISALAPVFESRTDEVLMILGIDIEAAVWKDLINYVRFKVLIGAIFLGILVFIGAILIHFRSKLKLNSHFFSYLEVYIITALSLAITLMVAFMLNDREDRGVKNSFSLIAEANFKDKLNSMRDLQDYELGGLVRFFEGSQYVDSIEFKNFTKPIIKQKWIESVIWIDVKNLNTSAASFPIRYIEPENSYRYPVGFDISRDSASQKALLTGFESKFPTSTPPVKNQIKNDSRITVFYPAYKYDDSNEKGQSSIIGFAAVEINLSQLIMNKDKSTKSYSDIEIFNLNPNNEAVLIASTNYSRFKPVYWNIDGHHNISIKEYSIIYPLFAFGATNALVISPDVEFIDSNILTSFWIAILVGLVFTRLLTSITIIVKRKQSELEQLVKNRTAELEKSEESLRLALDSAESANIQKDKFFSIIAHDLKSPFNGMLGFLQILQEDDNQMPEEQKKKLLGLLADSSKNLYSLLENLLQWSRVQRGLVETEFKNINLLNETNEVIKIIEANLQKKEITLTIFIPESLYVYADESMLNVILRNLISNAIKFTNKGGEIRIYVQSENGSVLVTIQDSGIGMDKFILDNLFNIGSSTGRSGTAGESSTGLGLILCEEYVKKLGGRIWAESEVGKGSKFFFTLLKEKIA